MTTSAVDSGYNYTRKPRAPLVRC